MGLNLVDIAAQFVLAYADCVGGDWPTKGHG